MDSRYDFAHYSVVQSLRKEERWGGEREIGSVFWIKVRMFSSFLAVPDKRLLAGYQRTCSRILKATPSSDLVKSATYSKSQITYDIYDGCYNTKAARMSVAPRIQLFHFAFAYFLDNIGNNFAFPDNIIRKIMD